ncbi:hypothetical protein Tco_0977220 [Tanacetum coccineum]|uniref:Uncharacterized protein n=1 Tax=Tanacetum coccineum TaxID=301880 RepID=A0ABQ5EJH6_9ASTR
MASRIMNVPLRHHVYWIIMLEQSGSSARTRKESASSEAGKDNHYPQKWSMGRRRENKATMELKEVESVIGSGLPEVGRVRYFVSSKGAVGPYTGVTSGVSSLTLLVRSGSLERSLSKYVSCGELLVCLRGYGGIDKLGRETGLTWGLTDES